MNGLVQQSKLFIKRNASTILTVAGGVGVVATTIMAVKATPKAVTLLEEAKQEKGEKLTTVEKVKVAWKPYIPAVLTGAGTIACIFGANVLNKRQQASLISAYAFLDNSYKEYVKKVEELYGEDADARVEQAIASDKFDNYEVISEPSTRLYYDEYSRQFFEASPEDVLRAEYEVNKTIAQNNGAYLNEFYDLLGLECPEGLEVLGWSQGILSSMYWTYWLDFDHSERTTEDGTKYTLLQMRQEPVIDFDFY